MITNPRDIYSTASPFVSNLIAGKTSENEPPTASQKEQANKTLTLLLKHIPKPEMWKGCPEVIAKLKKIVENPITLEEKVDTVSRKKFVVTGQPKKSQEITKQSNEPKDLKRKNESEPEARKKIGLTPEITKFLEEFTSTGAGKIEKIPSDFKELENILLKGDEFSRARELVSFLYISETSKTTLANMKNIPQGLSKTSTIGDAALHIALNTRTPKEFAYFLMQEVLHGPRGTEAMFSQEKLDDAFANKIKSFTDDQYHEFNAASIDNDKLWVIKHIPIEKISPENLKLKVQRFSNLALCRVEFS